MQQDVETEKRLVILEERSARLQTDQTALTAIIARLPSMEARIATLWELYPRLSKSVDTWETDARRLVWGVMMMAVGLAVQMLATKVGL